MKHLHNVNKNISAFPKLISQRLHHAMRKDLAAEGSIKSLFILITTFHKTVSKRSYNLATLHRIFKLQFHTIAVGVSMSGAY